VTTQEITQSLDPVEWVRIKSDLLDFLLEALKERDDLLAERRVEVRVVKEIMTPAKAVDTLRQHLSVEAEKADHMKRFPDWWKLTDCHDGSEAANAWSDICNRNNLTFDDIKSAMQAVVDANAHSELPGTPSEGGNG
jgi:hypothetical protein